MFYSIYTSADGTDLRGIAEIIIAKHRNGAVGDVRLRFIGQYTRFENCDNNMVPPPTDGGGVMRGSSMNASIATSSVPPPPALNDISVNPFSSPNDETVPF